MKLGRGYIISMISTNLNENKLQKTQIKVENQYYIPTQSKPGSTNNQKHEQYLPMLNSLVDTEKSNKRKNLITVSNMCKKCMHRSLWELANIATLA